MFSLADAIRFQDWFFAIALSIPRMMVCMYIVPVFYANTLSRTLRVFIAAGLCLPVLVNVGLTMGRMNDVPSIVMLIVKESVIGLFLGFALTMPFWAIDSVGALFDNQRGANAGQQSTPFSIPDLSQMGAALRMAFIVFSVTSGALGSMYDLLLHSYEAWPVMSLVPNFSGIKAELMIGRFSEMCQMSVLYAAPVLALLLLVDLAFAIVGIFAPQLPTYFASMPVKSMVGVLILIVYSAVLMQNAGHYMDRIMYLDFSLFSGEP
jgi:type III secretion protein T